MYIDVERVQEDEVHATQEERVHEDMHGDVMMMNTLEVLHVTLKVFKILI